MGTTDAPTTNRTNLDEHAFDVTSLYGRRATARWERVSLGDMLERVTWSRPEHPALIGWEGAYGDPRFASLTYREADEAANQLANALLARGLQRGDRIAMVAENSVEAYLTKFAAAKAGLVLAPMNPAFAPDVVEALVRRIEPAIAIVDDELWDHVSAPLTAAGVTDIVRIEIGDGGAPDGTTFGDLLAEQPTGEPDVQIHADDVWQILFTSGTTALPKASMVTHQASVLAAYSFALTLGRGVRVESQTVLASFLPLIYHVGDQIFSLPAFACGGTLVIGRRFDPAEIAAAVTEHEVTALWQGSPAMVNALVDTVEADRERYDLSTLHTIGYGWAAIPPATFDRLRELCGAQITPYEVFGQTECIPCHRFWPDLHEDLYRRTAPKDNYVGIASPMLAAKLVDPAGELVEEPGIVSEAVYRSPVITAGYYKDEQATREAFAGGWFHSGDSCVWGEDGQKIMVDRFKDIVKTGGENVSTIRVEAVLNAHPGVLKVAVVGLPDERWGEAVTAVVVPNDDAEQDADVLIAFARERLAGFETPKRVIYTDSLPETVGGKVLKYRLRSKYSE